jgi:hypothetical protein
MMKDKTQKAGELVERHIRETKKEIEQDRQAMRKKDMINE